MVEKPLKAIVNNCPCCTGKVLRHLGKKGFYWFCPQCRQNLPFTQQHLLKTSTKAQ